MYPKKLILLNLVFILFLSGCVSFSGHRDRHSRSTSLVDFLYPQGSLPLNDNPNPVLHLPLKVGLAFIPEVNSRNAILPSTKNELLEDVKAAFQAKEYVNEIIVIPEIYLQGKKGYTTLDQVKRLYQLDVIALVSYDQIVNSKDNLLSLSYLTIVGAYILPGTGYDINTLIDIAVIDVESRSILLRSAGTSAGKGAIPDAYAKQTYDKYQNVGFAQAMGQVQANLYIELNKFEQRLKAKDPNDRIKVKYRKGYSGSISLYLLIFLSLIAVYKFRNGKHS